MTFIASTVRVKAGSFNWFDPTDSGYKVVRLTNEPVFKPVAPGYWQVTLEMEEV
jgi:hypothetical protein